MGLSKIVSGSVLSSKACMIKGEQLIKFNGNSIDIPSTVQAPVVIAADCSTFHRFAIKAQHVKKGIWNTEIILKKNLIKVIPSGSLPKVLVNGQPIEIPVGTGKTVIAKDIVDHTVISETVSGHCVYSKPELELASWMIPSSSSSS